MGAYFAMERRTWKQLLKERSGRILVPLVAGSLLVFAVLATVMVATRNVDWRTFRPR